MNKQVYVAFYKHKTRVRNWKTFKERLIDGVIRVATFSKYSHCEIAIVRRDGQFDCYSSSLRDGGVRKKTMNLPLDRWDLVATDISKSRARRQFKKHAGKKYDIVGAVGFPMNCHDKNSFFCSEYCATVVGYIRTLLSPQALYNKLTKHNQESL